MKLISNETSKETLVTQAEQKKSAASINVTFEEQNNLMIVEVMGDLTTIDIQEFAYVVYVQNPRPYIIWDISRGSVESFTVDQLVDLAKQMAKFRIVNGGKTALIANSRLDFRLLQTYSIHAESYNKLVQYEVFHDMKDVKEWIFHDQDNSIS